MLPTSNEFAKAHKREKDRRDDGNRDEMGAVEDDAATEAELGVANHSWGDGIGEVGLCFEQHAGDEKGRGCREERGGDWEEHFQLHQQADEVFVPVRRESLGVLPCVMDEIVSGDESWAAVDPSVRGGDDGGQQRCQPLRPQDDDAARG